jgi:hypothetical protein
MHFGFLAIIKGVHKTATLLKRMKKTTRIVIHIYKHARKRKDKKELRIRETSFFFLLFFDVVLDKSSLSVDMIRQFFLFFLLPR